MKKQPLFVLTLSAALVGASPLAIAQKAPPASASTPASVASTAAAPVSITPASVLISGPAGQVTAGDVEQMVNQMLPPQQRPMFWGNPDTAKRVAQTLYAQQALAQMALKEKLDSTPDGSAKLKFAREQILAGLLVEARVKANMPDDKAVQAFARGEMKAHPDHFKIPEQIDVRHILLPVAKDGSDDAAVKAKAEDLLAQLRKGADFATLAKANSKDPGSADKGGDLGFFSRGRMVPAFEQAAFNLKKPGDLAGPVRSPFGYHIIELVARKPAGQMTLDQALPQLRQQLAAQRSADARKDLLDKVQGAAQVNQANIDALRQQQAAQKP
ncbi:MAG: peptidylprolyl isomerase [Burkholderiaceae bacterium]|nr:peptidylprolyl isomerase [Burkholderiaceae bacterium]